LSTFDAVPGYATTLEQGLGGRQSSEAFLFRPMPAFVIYSKRDIVDALWKHRQLPTSSLLYFNDPFEFHHTWNRTEPGSEEISKHFIDFMRHEKFAEPLPTIDDLQRYFAANFQRFQHAKKFIAAQELEERYALLLRTFDKYWQFICCTPSKGVRKSAEITMWSYYADSHKGVRVHLSDKLVARNGIQPVPIIYRKVPPFMCNKRIEDDPSGVFGEIAFTKGLSWRHEKETRLIVPRSILKKRRDSIPRGRLWLPVEEKDIVRVDLGMRNPQIENDRIKISEAFPHAKIFMAVKSARGYGCQYLRLG
jgi:hypothetical protein